MQSWRMTSLSHWSSFTYIHVIAYLFAHPATMPVVEGEVVDTHAYLGSAANSESGHDKSAAVFSTDVYILPEALERSYSKKIYGRSGQTSQLYEDAYSRYYYNAKSVLARPTPSAFAAGTDSPPASSTMTCRPSSFVAVIAISFLVALTILGLSSAKMVKTNKVSMNYIIS